MSGLKRGDYVSITYPTGDGELGRVASVDGDKAFVCFSTGCTAERCDAGDLRRVLGTFEQPGHRLGYHRFDAECPEYDPECCAAYCPEKGGE